MGTEKFDVSYSVMFVLIIVCATFSARSCHSPRLGIDPDLLASSVIPLHHRQTPTVDQSDDYLKGLNYQALLRKRNQQLTQQSDKEQESAGTGVYYVPLKHQGSLKSLKKEAELKSKTDKKSAGHHYALTAEEFERQKLGFERRLTLLQEHSEKNKKVIEKLTASFNALCHNCQQADVVPQPASHWPLLCGFYVVCMITILMTVAS